MMKNNPNYVHKINSSENEECNFIILSAGKSKVRGCKSPPPLVDVSKNKKLADLQIDNIRKSCAYPEIIMVVGFDADSIIEHVGAKHDDVKILENLSYKDTDPIVSLKLAINCLTKKRTYVIYGDRLFDKRSIEVENVSRSYLFSHGYNSKNKSLGITYNNGRLVNLSYGLPNIWSQIIYICKTDFDIFKEEVNNARSNRIYGMTGLISSLSSRLNFFVKQDDKMLIKTVKEIFDENFMSQSNKRSKTSRTRKNSKR